MVLPLASMGLKALASPLQGLGFGFGYGYGVRLGYHSFKPSKSPTVTGLRLSPEPTTSGVGMGLASAEEITGKSLQKLPIKGATQEPTPTEDPNIKRGTGGHKYTPEERFSGRKDYLHRYEAGAIVQSIPWDLARKIWKERGMKGSDRDINRAFKKQTYPFNKRVSRRR
jgi:hypothetical protein